MNRIGFIIGHQLHQIRLLHPDRIPDGDFGLMRFGWIADAVNRNPESGLHYELYRPWHRYDALVFIKAMGEREQILRDRTIAKGKPVLFDANVNYYDQEGTYYYEGMAPSDLQRRNAENMTRHCTAVIADSSFLATRCQAFNPRVRWVPDNVNMTLIPPVAPMRQNNVLNLMWSGQANKLFEFLAIEPVLRRFARQIRLRLVTNSLTGMNSWQPEVRQRFTQLLTDIPHDILPYSSVSSLLTLYAKEPCIGISPRFLDNTYNLGHTEWKIALPMACGRLTLASPVPSYLDVASRSHDQGIWICPDTASWETAFDRLLSNQVDWNTEAQAARNAIIQHYSTPVVAQQHTSYLNHILTSV
jgi:hypothetical protein